MNTPLYKMLQAKLGEIRQGEEDRDERAAQVAQGAINSLLQFLEIPDECIFIHKFGELPRENSKPTIGDVLEYRPDKKGHRFAISIVVKPPGPGRMRRLTYQIEMRGLEDGKYLVFADADRKQSFQIAWGSYVSFHTYFYNALLEHVTWSEVKPEEGPFRIMDL